MIEQKQNVINNSLPINKCNGFNILVYSDKAYTILTNQLKDKAAVMKYGADFNIPNVPNENVIIFTQGAISSTTGKTIANLVKNGHTVIPSYIDIDNESIDIEDYISKIMSSNLDKNIILPLVELDKCSVKGALTKMPPEPSYLVLGLIRRAITGFLEGAGGTSKSTALLQLQVSLATRRYWLGKFSIAPESIGSSFVIYGEETQEEINFRLYHICKQMELTPKEITLVEERVFTYAAVNAEYSPILTKDGGNEATPTDVIDRLLVTLKGLDNLSFVGIDPLAKFFGGNLMDSKDAYRYTQELKRIAKEKNATVLTLNHINKVGLREGGSVGAAGYGSVGLRDSSRIMMNLTTMKETEATKKGIEKSECEYYVRLTVTKNNYTAPQKEEYWFKRGEAGILDYVQFDAESTAEKGYTDWIHVLNYIQNGLNQGLKYHQKNIKEAHITDEHSNVLSQAKKVAALEFLLNKGKLLTEEICVGHSKKPTSMFVLPPVEKVCGKTIEEMDAYLAEAL